MPESPETRENIRKVDFGLETAWEIRKAWAGKAKRGGKQRWPVIYTKLISLFQLEGNIEVTESYRPEKPPVENPPPIIVAKTVKGKWHLVDGRHRVLAWRKEGFTHTMAWILDYTGNPRL